MYRDLFRELESKKMKIGSLAIVTQTGNQKLFRVEEIIYLK